MMSRVKMIRRMAPMMAGVAMAPIRMRRNPPSPPVEAEHYAIPELAPSTAQATVLAADVAKVGTPDGGWSDWPPLVLAESDEPLVEGAPDLRGVWLAHHGPMKGHVERVEQAGDRVVITAGGVIHDMFADGSLDGGVDDVGVGGVAIRVAARFEDGRLNLYLNDQRLVVTRYLVDSTDPAYDVEMIWRWGPYTSRLHRLLGADRKGSDPNN